MKEVVQTLKRTAAEERIPVLRLELNYELATLHDAIMTEDDEQIKCSKQRLEALRQELLILEV